MARYAKANQHVEDLRSAIEDVGDLYDVVELPKVKKDLSKIDVDFENVMSIEEWAEETSQSQRIFHEIEMLMDVNGKQFPVAWCLCGGDWQLPLLFVVYLDQTNHLRGYIPSDGNPYDHEHKRAWEGDDEGAEEEWENWPNNIQQLTNDVANRILVKE